MFVKKIWRINNRNNWIYPISLFPRDRVNIGNYSYGELNVLVYGPTGDLRIGNCCSIGPHVTFLLCVDHNMKTVSTFPYKTKIFNERANESVSNGDIIVSDDVWIGYGSTILSGVHIGQGAVVAAGAVVSKDVSPYAVVGGVPAKVIKYRFEQSVIDYMLTLDYSALTEDLIREHVDDLYTEIDGMELEEVKKVFAWFPKKSQAASTVEM